MSQNSAFYLYALILVVSIFLRGIVDLFTKPRRAFNSCVLHFAAGIVFLVVTVELLPDIVKNHKPLEVGI